MKDSRKVTIQTGDTVAYNTGGNRCTRVSTGVIQKTTPKRVIVLDNAYNPDNMPQGDYWDTENYKATYMTTKNPKDVVVVTLP